MVHLLLLVILRVLCYQYNLDNKDNLWYNIIEVIKLNNNIGFGGNKKPKIEIMKEAIIAMEEVTKDLYSTHVSVGNILESRVKHIYTVAELMKKVALKVIKQVMIENDFCSLKVEDNNILYATTYDAIVAAYLHDVGYIKSIQEFGYHPVDGYLYVKKKWGEPVIADVILWHMGAKELAPSELNHFYKDVWYGKSKVNEFKFKILSILVDFCDSHVDSEGRICTLDKRLSDITKRHGFDSKRVVVFKAALSTLKANEKYILDILGVSSVLDIV